MNILDVKPNVVSKGVEGKYFLFYGDPSTRKTTVAANFPNALLLATEIGYSLIPGVRAVNIDSWATFRDVVRQLKQPTVKNEYKTIVIDTVGLLTDMCLKYICDVNGVAELSEIPWGQGWSKFKREFRSQINTMAQLGYSIVFIAHAEVKRDENGSLVSAVPQMEKKPRESVIALVDFILFLQKEQKPETGEITVYAYSNLASAIESKSRARYLKPKFEFTFDNLEKEVRHAVEKFEEQGTTYVAEETINLHTNATSMPFAQLKEEVLTLAKTLLGPEVPEAIKQGAAAIVQPIMQGLRLTEATEAHYDKLAVLKEALMEYSETIK